jgi:3-phosphoshikimate 1-carboxyvinyltransferase
LAAKLQVGGSKSVSNRLLLIRELCESSFSIKNLSTSADTFDMLRVLDTKEEEWSLGEGGTTARFVLALAAFKPGNRVLSVSGSMATRPIEPLVKALITLGAQISYLKTEGQFPVRVTGGNLTGGTIQVDGSLGSQFVSALLMIGPYLQDGLQITLSNDQTSISYIDLTVRIMEELGVKVDREGAVLSVSPQAYSPRNITVSDDWSSAAFWFGLAALSTEAEFTIDGLKMESLQGDQIVTEMIKPFGVQTAPSVYGVHITRKGARAEQSEFDLSSTPDLLPVLAVVSAGTGVPVRFTGIDHVRHKESDRIHALTAELAKGGVQLEQDGTGWQVTGQWQGEKLEIDTHNDHRIAMAFSLLGMISPITINDPEVVNKSYPNWWEELRKTGMQVTDTGSAQ